MKLEKTLKRVRNATIGVGLTALSVLGIGCETMNTADWLAFSFGTIARDADLTPEQRESAAYLEQIAKKQSQRQHEKDIAEKSRDETNQEVNVYVERENKQLTEKELDDIAQGYEPGTERDNVEQKPRVEQKLIDKYCPRTKRVGNWIAPPISFNCSGFKDLNKDGYMGKDELINLGNYFKCEEKIDIICGAIWYNAKESLVTSKITETKTGEIIKVDNGDRLQSNNESRLTHLNLYKSNKNKGIQEYTLEWLVDGKLIPTRTINFFVDYGQNTQQNPGEFLIYNNWDDANQNGILEKNELSGLGKKVFNLDKEMMEVCFKTNKSGVVTFESYCGGVYMGRTKKYYKEGDADGIRHWTGLDAEISQMDFMDRIQENGPGNYLITAYFKGSDGTSQHHKIDVKIVE